jgi:23S rRNA (cytidine1920-2'-O)/16S rRNA (cytidine1409-2'-O)-methyltransferase
VQRPPVTAPKTHSNAGDARIETRRRADQLLVEHGLVDSRAKAQAAIAAGLVSADGWVVRKPSEMLAVDAALRAAPAHPYVSRGGVKLAAALDGFAIDPAGRTCLDLGASTGGFTDVLLRRGAARVYAIDVGRGQLHPSLAQNPRVVSREATDARSLDPAMFPELPDLVVIDVSFISLALVLPAAARLVAERADLVALIKPQFEAGRANLRKGIVRDPAVHAAVGDAVSALLAGLGFAVRGLIPSPLLGGDGNREFLIGARRG